MTWHLILYMLIEIIGFVWAISGDSRASGYFAISSRDCRITLWLVLTFVFTLIYGGIFWW